MGEGLLPLRVRLSKNPPKKKNKITISHSKTSYPPGRNKSIANWPRNLKRITVYRKQAKVQRWKISKQK